MASDFVINYTGEEPFCCKTALHEKDANSKMESYRFNELKMLVLVENVLVGASGGGGSFQVFLVLEKEPSDDQMDHLDVIDYGEMPRSKVREMHDEVRVRDGIIKLNVTKNVDVLKGYL